MRQSPTRPEPENIKPEPARDLTSQSGLGPARPEPEDAKPEPARARKSQARSAPNIYTPPFLLWNIKWIMTKIKRDSSLSLSDKKKQFQTIKHNEAVFFSGVQPH